MCYVVSYIPEIQISSPVAQVKGYVLLIPAFPASTGPNTLLIPPDPLVRNAVPEYLTAADVSNMTQDNAWSLTGATGKENEYCPVPYVAVFPKVIFNRKCTTLVSLLNAQANVLFPIAGATPVALHVGVNGAHAPGCAKVDHADPV